MNDSIKRLEEKIAFLERHVTEQDRAMLEMAEDIARLKREVKAMRAQVATKSDVAESDDAPDERPPHY